MALTLIVFHGPWHIPDSLSPPSAGAGSSPLDVKGRERTFVVFRKLQGQNERIIPTSVLFHQNSGIRPCLMVRGAGKYYPISASRKEKVI